MQPEINQQPVPGVEQEPVRQVSGPENIPSLPPLESQVERGQQASEQLGEMRAAIGGISAPQAVPQQQASIPQHPAPTDAQQTKPLSAPVTAADDDLIEKEWVENAKKVVQETKDDPHARSSRISELREDYLSKRHGRVIGAGE